MADVSVVSFPRFAWSCGEEGSDPLVSHEGAIVRVDEFARSAHLEHQDEDLAAVASLGVRVWRYGMPWRQVERAPGVYDWSLWDRALAACERHGLEPVVDLCHSTPTTRGPHRVGEVVRYGRPSSRAIARRAGSRP
jgi:hypothetical protein